MPSITDLMKSPDVGRPERTYPLCVAGRLARDLESVDAELFEVQDQIETALAIERERRESGAPRRMGETSPLPDLERRADELAAQADEIRARMEEHTIDLLIVGKSNGEWRQWVSKHPPRDPEQDKAAAERDRRYAAGFCDIDALIADAGRFVAKYGDDDATEEMWAFVLDNASPGDLTRLASAVVGMHEQVIQPGKSRAAWRASRRSSSDSE